MRVSHNTFVNNRTHIVMPGRTNGLGATDLVFSNNIIQGESGTALTLPGPTPGARYEGNLVFGVANGALPAGGVRRMDPQLSRDAAGIFRPLSSSPAIDASVGSYSEVSVDLDGQPRSGPRDVGADEASSAPTLNRPLTPADVGPGAR